MAMMDSLSALAGLTSNASNPNSSVQGYLSRRKRLDEMKRNLSLSGVDRNAQGAVTSGFATGATPQDVESLEADMDRDPDMGLQAQEDVAHTRGVNQATTDFLRPDVTKVRGIQKNDALEKLLAPIQMRGQFDVEAAKQSQLGQRERDDRLYGDRLKLQDDRQAANPQKAPVAQAGTTAKLLGAQGKNTGGFFDRMMGKTVAPSPDVLSAIREMSMQEGTNPDLVNDAMKIIAQFPTAGVDELLAAAEKSGVDPLEDDDRADFVKIFSRVR